MLFNSLTFLFFFLPVLLLGYYALPARFRNHFLLIASILFYAWGGFTYSILLLVSILFNFLFVRKIGGRSPHRKRWLHIGITFNVLIIVFFKYLNFLIENALLLGGLFMEESPEAIHLKIVMPIGISFFTFQQMSLLWDVYRSSEPVKLKFSQHALYISFFPQLIAGPIVRFNDIIDQIKERVSSIELFHSGVRRFIIGLFKKVILANGCAAIADSIMDAPLHTINAPIAWLGIAAYTLQIYFDFSGYSDMAIGLVRMFGFKILENFNFPYISRSIQEFWRRWHMSLSYWFKDYVYIPLGGNRISVRKTYINLFIVFLLTGIWHGATWSFVFWGLFHGVWLIIERVGFGKLLKRAGPIVGWMYTLLLVQIGWVYFRIEDFVQATAYVSKLFGFGYVNNSSFVSYLDLERVLILAIAIICSTPLLLIIRKQFKKLPSSIQVLHRLGTDLILILMLLVSVMYINSGSYNPFIYFNF